MICEIIHILTALLIGLDLCVCLTPCDSTRRRRIFGETNEKYRTIDYSFNRGIVRKKQMKRQETLQFRL